MLRDLSRTKLYLPTPRPSIITRQRLIKSLEEGLTYPLTLLCAPAGYGKTTLLCHALAIQQLSTAWLSLDKQDNDLTRFWMYVIKALQTIRSGLGQSVLAALQSLQPPAPITILPTLLDQLGRRRSPLVLVLDDYQFVSDRAIHETLAYFLENLPPTVHLVISTRVDPPLPLGRLRVRNQLFELRASDLRFTNEETVRFLQQSMGLSLSSEDVAALEIRTEGWIAGLQLAALSMRGQSDLTVFVNAFTGSHVYVAEYLVEEVLQHQGEDMQRFLLQTAILDRLSGRLCEAVTGCADGQAVLTALDRANLFLIPLDSRAEWFRYHHLFADLLRARLHQTFTADELALLHQRAAEWYAQHGFLREAIDHALHGKAYDHAATLVEQNARAMMFAGSLNLLKQWLEALPKSVEAEHPRLTIYKLWIDVIQGKADLSEHTLQATDSLLNALPESPENMHLRLEWKVISCRFIALSGNTARAIQFAQEALEKLPEGDLASRARVQSALSIAYGMEGDADKAQATFQQCYTLALSAGYYSLAAHTTMMMAAALDQHYGQLREAARLYRSIIDMGDHAGQSVFFPAGQGYIGLAAVYLEQNNLESAEGCLRQGLTLCAQAGLAGLSMGYAIESRLRQVKGDVQGALESAQLVEQVGPRGDPTGMIRQIQLRLGMGDIEGAARWAAPLMSLFNAPPASIRLPLLVQEYFSAILARVLLAQGNVERASQLLDRLLTTADHGKRYARMMDVHLLRALALQKQYNGVVTGAALADFIQALELAKPEGYRRYFLDEGPAILPLLSAVIKSPTVAHSIRAYAQTLLDMVSGHNRSAARQETNLVEALTARETEVLLLIAAGDSNRAIADKLIITVSAVKKHTGNIFGKLGVSSRTQAIVRARHLGLTRTD